MKVLTIKGDKGNHILVVVRKLAQKQISSFSKECLTIQFVDTGI